MFTRKSWPMALSVIFVGSVAVIVWGDEAKDPPTRPTTDSPAQAASPEARKAIKPKELGKTVSRGLEYLISQQHDDGGFGQGGGWRLAGEAQSSRVEGKDVKDPPDVGNTCMAALALIRAGNTPAAGKYSRQLVKAIEFIEKNVEQSDTDSLYVTPVRDTQLQSKIGRYVDTFLTALVLSELKGQMPDKKSEERLFAALNKTIGKIEKNQQADGTFAGNAGWASVLSQGLCSKALNRAAQKGVAVKAETIKRDVDQTVAQLAPAGTVGGVGTPVTTPTTASGPAESTRGEATIPAPGLTGRSAAAGGVAGKGDAGVQLYSLSANASRLQDTVNTNRRRKEQAEQVINSPTADAPAKQAAQQELNEVAATERVNADAGKQVAANLSNAGFVKGFGNNGGEEFLSYMNISETLLAQGGEAWEKWDRQACDTISQVQNEDGSWSGHHCITGRTFCTAAALLTMMADRAPVPVTSTQPAAK